MPNALMHWVKDAQAEGQEINKALEQLKALLEGLTVVTPIGPKVVDLIDLVRARAQSIEFQMNGLAARYVLPAVVSWDGPESAGDRLRIERAVQAGVRRAIAATSQEAPPQPSRQPRPQPLQGPRARSQPCKAQALRPKRLTIMKPVQPKLQPPRPLL